MSLITTLTASFNFKDEKCPKKAENYFDICCSNKAIAINRVSDNLSQKFLIECYPRLHLPFGDVLHIQLIDQETTMELYQHSTTSLDKLKKNATLFPFLFKKSEFDKLRNSIEKKRFLLKKIYEALQDYAHLYQLNFEGIDNSHEKLMNSDFYFYSHKPMQFKGTELHAGIQKSLEFNPIYDNYRFVIWDRSNDISKIYQLPKQQKREIIMQKYDGSLKKAWKEKINPPHTYTLIGWKRNKFLFSWGYEEGMQPYELYEFSLKTNEIKRIN